MTQNIRKTFRTDQDGPDGAPFEIIGFTMEDCGGDHPEPMFTILVHGNTVIRSVNAECLFEDYDPAFDDKLSD